MGKRGMIKLDLGSVSVWRIIPQVRLTSNRLTMMKYNDVVGRSAPDLTIYVIFGSLYMPEAFCSCWWRGHLYWIISDELQLNEILWLLISCFFTEKQFNIKLVSLYLGAPHSPGGEFADSNSQKCHRWRQQKAEDLSCSSWSRAQLREGQGEFTTSGGRLIRKNFQAISICIFAGVGLGKGRWF